MFASHHIALTSVFAYAACLVQMYSLHVPNTPLAIVIRPVPIMSMPSSLSPTLSLILIDRPSRDAACYFPKNPPTLAHWLTSRIEPVWMETLAGFHKRCVICEQPMCDYSRKAAIKRDNDAEAQARQQGEKARDTRGEVDSQQVRDTPVNPAMPQDRDDREAPNRASPQDWPTPQPPAKGSLPNPKISSLSAQIAILRLLQPIASASSPHTLTYPDLGHTCCTPAGRCEIPLHISTTGCGHYAGHVCLQRWILLGKNWCRFCGVLWFREQHDKTARRAIWKECTDTEVVGIDLWADIPEDGDGLQGRDEDGRVREGEWEDILMRERENLCERI
jgi:hypothetical protein